MRGRWFSRPDPIRLDLAEFVVYTERDLAVHAPGTQQFLPRGGMTVQALTEATQTTSDNDAVQADVGRLVAAWILGG